MADANKPVENIAPAVLFGQYEAALAANELTRAELEALRVELPPAGKPASLPANAGSDVVIERAKKKK